MTPSASIVLTTYATPGPLLAISIDSVLHQTRTDLELVLVVDGDLAPEAEAVIDRLSSVRAAG
jgi:glycosyltransferase involved in cell wall biosynthesis